MNSLACPCAELPDAREEENLVIAKMHVLFAKFYNKVLQLLRSEQSLSLGPEGRFFR